MKAPRWMRALLGFGAVTVVALFGLNIYMALKPVPKPRIDQPLANLLPHAPMGWNFQDLDIASSPEELAQVEGILHFDDAVYRTYSNSEAQIDVYIAHWLPGRFSPAKVGSHSPDTCWVHNGWDMLERNQGVTRDFDGGTLKPMETGVFQKNHEKVHVIFWHLVGGEPMAYDLTGWHNGLTGRIERLPTLFADFSRFGLDQRKEQLVIRLSSTEAFDQMWADPGFVQFMDQLSRAFDLYAKPPPAADSSVKQKVAGVSDVERMIQQNLKPNDPDAKIVEFLTQSSFPYNFNEFEHRYESYVPKSQNTDSKGMGSVIGIDIYVNEDRSFKKVMVETVYTYL